MTPGGNVGYGDHGVPQLRRTYNDELHHREGVTSEFSLLVQAQCEENNRLMQEAIFSHPTIKSHLPDVTVREFAGSFHSTVVRSRFIHYTYWYDREYGTEVFGLHQDKGLYIAPNNNSNEQSSYIIRDITKWGAYAYVGGNTPGISIVTQSTTILNDSCPSLDPIVMNVNQKVGMLVCVIDGRDDEGNLGIMSSCGGVGPNGTGGKAEGKKKGLRVPCYMGLHRQ